MNIVDLHVHSNKSDGTLSPAQLVDLAMTRGLTAFALTDHDTVEGLDEAFGRVRELEASPDKAMTATILEVIPGIELSTEYEGKDIHILGLYIDHKNPAFVSRLQDFVDTRITRNHKMCALLREHGIPITYQALVEAYPDCVITRAHYGQWMMDQGYVKSVKEAFDRYIGDRGPCFIPREKITPAQAVELILGADGIPVLAHPTLYHMSDARLEKLVAQLKEAGLLAIEAVYSTYSTAEERQMRRLAAKYGLLITGGSDFHGKTKPGLELATGYGRLFLPEEILAQLKQCRRYAVFTDMDGTLLQDDKTISQAMYEGIEAFVEKGNHLILTTGRALPSVRKVKEKLKLHHPGCRIVIGYNGGQVYDTAAERELIGHRIHPEDVRFIIKECDKWGLHVHSYDEEYILARTQNPEIDYYVAHVKSPVRYVDDLADACQTGPHKLLCISLDNHQRLLDFRAHLAPLLAGRVTLMFSNDKYLEFLPAGSGKGNALAFVRDYLHLPASHTYAAGDQENDITMIEAAGQGVAVANAIDLLKEKADIVTRSDNNHDGLLEILKMLTEKTEPS